MKIVRQKNTDQLNEELKGLSELLLNFKHKKYTAYVEHQYLTSVQIRIPTKFFMLFSKNFSRQKHGVTNMLYQFENPGMCKLYIEKVWIVPFIKRVRTLVKHLKNREDENDGVQSTDISEEP